MGDFIPVRLINQETATMAKRSGMYSANKRKKELKRQKKQEEKRLKKQKNIKDNPEESDTTEATNSGQESSGETD